MYGKRGTFKVHCRQQYMFFMQWNLCIECVVTAFVVVGKTCRQYRLSEFLLFDKYLL